MKKIVAIGDEEFVIGFSLSGCESYIEENPSKILQIIKEIISKGDTGLILIKEELARPIKKEIQEMKLKVSVPLIYEIPGPTGTRKIEDYRQLIRQILGV